MIIVKGKNKFTNLNYCTFNQETVEDSIKLYNHLLLSTRYYNPIGAFFGLKFNHQTKESGVNITSCYYDVDSETINNYLLTFYN